METSDREGWIRKTLLTPPAPWRYASNHGRPLEETAPLGNECVWRDSGAGGWVTATTARGVKMNAITLIKMTDYETGEAVYVNPATITRVNEREVKEGVATDVHFVGGEYLIVKENVSEIFKKLGLEPKQKAD